MGKGFKNLLLQLGEALTPERHEVGISTCIYFRHNKRYNTLVRSVADVTEAKYDPETRWVTSTT